MLLIVGVAEVNDAGVEGDTYEIEVVFVEDYRDVFMNATGDVGFCDFGFIEGYAIKLNLVW